jgi:hypothetical protein
MSASEEAIKDALENAFSDELRMGTKLSHQECIEFRSRMPALAIADVKEVLPQVLLDLLDHRTGDIRNTEDAEDVIWFLSPDLGMEEGAPEAELPPGIAALRIDLLQTFSEFSPKQRRAVVKWLEAALTWQDFDLRKDQVAGALKFWIEHAREQ